MALFFLSRVVLKLDREYLSKNILPSLEYIVSRDKTPAVTTAVVGLYKQIADNGATITMISVDMLPSLVPLLSDRSFQSKQFEQFTQLTGYLLNKVVEARCQQYGIPSIDISDVSAFRDDPRSDIELDREIRNDSFAWGTGEQEKMNISGMNFPRDPYPERSISATVQHSSIQSIASADARIHDNTVPPSGGTLPPKGLAELLSSSSSSQFGTSAPAVNLFRPVVPSDLIPNQGSQVGTFHSYGSQNSNFSPSLPAYPHPATTIKSNDPFDFGFSDMSAGAGTAIVGHTHSIPLSGSSRNSVMQERSGDKEDPFAFLNS